MQEGLIDLLKKQSMQINGLLEHLWNSISHKKISPSEWNIIEQISFKECFISEITKTLSISRQGIHKLIKQLEEKEIVKVFYTEQNKRNQCICLTPLGNECLNKYIQLKKEIEKTIAIQVGNETVTLLKNILQKDWGI